MHHDWCHFFKLYKLLDVEILQTHLTTHITKLYSVKSRCTNIIISESVNKKKYNNNNDEDDDGCKKLYIIWKVNL